MTLVDAFVKNPGRGFAAPYLHNGLPHDHVSDFTVRMKTAGPDRPLHLILETRGFDPLGEIKALAARPWADAVNADGAYNRWKYAVAGAVSEIDRILRNRPTGDLPCSAI